jgi:hypothetical protein
LLTVIAAAGGLLIAGTPAITAAPAAAGTGSQATQAAVTPVRASLTAIGVIYLHASPGYGWTTHGNNAQLTIQDTGWTSFYLTATSTPNWVKIHVANSSHCIEGEGGGDTSVIATDCQEGNANQIWAAFVNNGGCTLKNQATGKLATVYNDTNGKPVWESTGPAGSWITWSTSANLWPACNTTP